MMGPFYIPGETSLVGPLLQPLGVSQVVMEADARVTQLAGFLLGHPTLILTAL